MEGIAQPAGDMRSASFKDQSKKFLTWTMKDWNLSYALQFTGILNIFHALQSVIIFGRVRQTCPMEPYDESFSYCQWSFPFFTNSTLSSFIFLAYCLNRKKNIRSFYSTSFLLSMLTFAIVRSTCQGKLDSETVCYGFYCKTSTFVFVASNAFFSSLLLLSCLLSKKTETRLFGMFKETHYIVYFTFLFLSSVALMSSVASRSTDRIQNEAHSNSTLDSANRYRSKEAVKVLKILGKAALMTGAVLGSILFGLNMIGFRAGGVAKRSFAAAFQSDSMKNRQPISSDEMFAILQGVGAAGLTVTTKLAVFAGCATAAILETFFN